MRQKLKLIKPQYNDKIEKRIDVLKEKLARLHLDYYAEVYHILKEIYDLRKSQMKKYSFGSIANEKGINLTRGQIYYYQKFEKMSPETKRLVASGKLNVGTVLFSLRKSIKFQNNHKLQDKMFDTLLCKRMSTTDFSHFPADMLVERIESGKASPIQDKMGVNIYTKLNTIWDYVKINKYSIRKDVLLKIANECQKIIEECRFDNKQKR